MMDYFEEDTVKLHGPKAANDRFFAPSESRLKACVAAATHVGKVRQRNEDHFAVVRYTRSREVLATNLPIELLDIPDSETYGLIVADGVGGANSGDVASRLALQTVLDLAARTTSWVMRITDLEAQEVRQRVEAYVAEVQKTLGLYSDANPRLAGMGTTWTSAHVLGRHAIIVHVGDSRVYLFRDAELRLLTRDQTLAQEMIDAGVESRDAARFKNILTNSLGGGREEVAAEIYDLKLCVRDRLLLCSDGLSDYVAEATIAGALALESTPQAACDRLIRCALDVGAPDNVTVILCDLLSGTRA